MSHEPISTGSQAKSSGTLSTILSKARRYAGRSLAIVGGFTVIGVGVTLWELKQRTKLEAVVSKAFILELDLETCSVVDKARPSPLELLIGEDKQLGLASLLHALREAGKDQNCQGLVAYVGPRESFQGGLAQVQEVRDAVYAFKASATKRLDTSSLSRPLTAAYSSSFGEGGTQGTLPYYFATAFDNIFVQPTGIVSTTGFESTMVFLRGMLDKLKIKPQFLTREEYKTAANMFTETSMNAAQRESMESIVHDYANQVTEGIAAARNLDTQAVSSCIDSAPHLAKDAHKLRLIDGTKYKDEVIDMMCKRGNTTSSNNNSSNPPTDTAVSSTGSNATSNTMSNAASSTLVGNAVSSTIGDAAVSTVSNEASSTAISTPSNAAICTINSTTSSITSSTTSGAISGTTSNVASFSSAGSTNGEDNPLPRVSIQQYLEILDTRKATVDEEREREELHRAVSKKMDSDVKRWLGVSREDKGETDKGVDEQLDLEKLKERERPPHIALLMLNGPIMQGGPGTPPGPPDPTGKPPARIESRKLSQQLQALAKLESVKAVVIRVNSPGGSAVASDTLYRSIVQLKQAGKKVVVSMGDVAASGGYFIAAPADKIVALPGTLTGSIGVVMGKFNASDFLSDLGVQVESIVVGKNATAGSLFADWTPDQLAHADKMIEGIYEDFVGKVAAGRKMSMEQALKVAKGRVWTGKQAKDLGLVDELGGLLTALEVARDAAGLPADKDIYTQVVEYPPQKIPPWLRYLRNMGAKRSDMPSNTSLSQFPQLLYLLLSENSQHNPMVGEQVASGYPTGDFSGASWLFWHLPASLRRSLHSLVTYLPHSEGVQMFSWEAEAFTHMC